MSRAKNSILRVGNYFCGFAISLASTSQVPDSEFEENSTRCCGSRFHMERHLRPDKAEAELTSRSTADGQQTTAKGAELSCSPSLQVLFNRTLPYSRSYRFMWLLLLYNGKVESLGQRLQSQCIYSVDLHWGEMADACSTAAMEWSHKENKQVNL